MTTPITDGLAVTGTDSDPTYAATVNVAPTAGDPGSSAIVIRQPTADHGENPLDGYAQEQAILILDFEGRVIGRWSWAGIGTTFAHLSPGANGTDQPLGPALWVQPTYNTWGAIFSMPAGATYASIVTNGFVDYQEMAAPAAPPVNTARVFCRDNGSGRSQLCVRFNTGAIQVVATQP